VNNWDLVDASAGTLVGASVAPHDLALLDQLARSRSLWERRIAMVATFHHTKRGDVGPALHVAERQLGDRHDLNHKAVGWMLREVGKRDRAALEAFLDAHYDRLPRTTLRYAIERFPEADRRAYLARGARSS
jgi:3-methyladenine DNA glycosylase AlkD